MPRRKKTKQSSSSVIIIASVAALALGAAGFFLIPKGKSKEKDREAGEFRVDYYFDDATRLIGGRYNLSGKTVQQQKWTEDKGRLWVVAVKNNQGSERELGILIPQEFAGQNIQVGEEWDFVVEVRAKGAIIVKSMKKS